MSEEEEQEDMMKNLITCDNEYLNWLRDLIIEILEQRAGAKLV